MNQTLKEVYITMLSKNIEWENKTRLFEAQFVLTELGIPFNIEITNDRQSEWKEFTKWIKE